MQSHEGKALLPGSVVKDTKHGHNSIGGAIGSSDIGAHSSYVMDGEPDSACAL